GALLAASHAQVTFMGALFALPLLVLSRGAVRRRLALAAAGAGIAGVALYAPGLAHHRLPFAWTHTGEAWWVSGYPWHRMLRWTLDFELFDQHRGIPLVTSMWLL